MNRSRKLRCAIYTRKSSEEGLDQDFTSLDAQREACAAYIQSQRHEGWTLLPAHYDDGGYSGGNLDRPALQQLLAAVDAGQVDLIVVYKIDRLTRSLADFAKIVERLDVRSASFVSVTQSFNTTTSIGRLTLNVLLSFAQFEREVTGERIRDKIAASKKKGMWMGGLVPLGYEAIDRQLVIQREEAAIVRRIFDLYRTHRNIAEIQRLLVADGITSKRRPHAKGRGQGGVTYSSGALHSLLRNPLYCGQIRHKGFTYPGQHPAIVPEAEWRDVQSILQNQRAAVVRRARGKNPLLGMLTDEQGRSYQAVHTTKGGQRYRYYVSRKEKSSQARLRVPAAALEEQVVNRICNFLRTPSALLDATSSSSDNTKWKKQVLEHAAELAKNLETTYRTFLQRVVLRAASIDLVLNVENLRQRLGAEADGDEPTAGTMARSDNVTLSIEARLHKTGHELRFVVEAPTGVATATKRDEKLVRLLAKGRRWYEELTSGQVTSIRGIAQREALPNSYVSRVLHGSLLAPDLIEKILKGTQPITLTVEALRSPPPLAWDEQRHRFDVVGK